MLRKTTILLLFSLFATVQVKAQWFDLAMFFLGSPGMQYGAVEFKATSIHGEPLLLYGGKIGVPITDKWMLGGDYRIGRSAFQDWVFKDAYDVIYASGGLSAEYKFREKGPFLLSMPVNAGIGRVILIRQGGGFTRVTDFFAFEPGVNASINPTGNWRIGMGLSFRSSLGSRLQVLPDHRMASPAYTVYTSWGF